MLHPFAFVLLFASFLQPLHFLPWVSWHSEVLAFLAVLLMAWHIALCRSGKGTARDTSSNVAKSVSNEIHLPVTALPLMGLGLVACSQWLVGLIPFFGEAVVYCLYYLLCLTAMALGYRSDQRQDGLLMAMAGTVLAAAVASAFIALAQAFELSRDYGWMHSMPYLRRPGANLGQPNQLATLLLMGLASLLLLVESRKIGTAVATLVAGVLLVGLAATESRAGLLGFAMLNLWWYTKRKLIGSRLPLWCVSSIVLAFVGLYWSWPTWMSEAFQMGQVASQINSNAYNRWLIWPQLVQAVFLRPWLGWGLGQVSTAHNAVMDVYSKSEPYTYAHNIVLDFALGIGLPLAALLLCAIGVWLWRRLRANHTVVSWYCMAMVLLVATHSLVEFPFAYAYFLVPVMFALGALESQLGSQPVVRLSPKYVGIGLLMATATFVLSTAEYLAIEEDFRIVRFEALRYGTTPQDYERPKVYLFTQLDALLHGGRIVPRPNMPSQEIELARKVALHFPWPATQDRYAMSLALNGNPAEAVRQLRAMRAQLGEKAYGRIKAAWTEMANEKYPQLHELQIP